MVPRGSETIDRDRRLRERSGVVLDRVSRVRAGVEGASRVGGRGGVEADDRDDRGADERGGFGRRFGGYTRDAFGGRW